jgi:uncharacterized protein (DUF58 family)
MAASGLMRSVWESITHLLRESKHPAAYPAAVDAPLLGNAEIAEILHHMQRARRLAKFSKDVRQRHAGDFRSAYLGRGLDYEESRPYQRGDDVRAMDWRTTARTGKPYVKIYREEHQPGLHVVVDRNAGMRFGTRRQLKAAQAVRVAAMFAFAAATSNTCIGGTLWQPGGYSLRCRNGFEGAMQLVEAANAPCPPLDQGATAPCFSTLLQRLEALLPRGSRVLLISDFTSLREGDLAALLSLAARHELVAVQILDAVEQALPNVGLMHFQDGATGQARWIDTASRDVRETYANGAQTLQQMQTTLLRRAGVQLHCCATDEDPFELLLGVAIHG